MREVTKRRHYGKLGSEEMKRGKTVTNMELSETLISQHQKRYCVSLPPMQIQEKVSN